MRLKETLTTQKKISLLSGNVVGIFPTMIVENDPFFNRVYDLCFGYYTERSASKTISSTFEDFIKFVEEHNTEINSTADELMGKLVRAKFIEKWNRIYEALISSNYNPLNNYDETETKTGNNQDKTTYNTVLEKSTDGTDTTTYDTEVNDDGSTSSKETTSRTTDNSDSRFGFNSVSAVGVTEGDTVTEETVTSLPEDNTQHNTQTKTGTETKNRDYTDTDTKTGTDTKDFTINETNRKNGRNTSASTLLMEELNLRDEKIFFDIVYKDIDSIVTIPIYESEV